MWRRLQWELGAEVRVRVRMAGLFADLARYQDPLNDIHKPQQIAPQWFELGRSTGTPINPALWQHDPPSSSYPARVAVKASEQLGPRFSELYLRRLREAALLEARNISRPLVLQEIAAETLAEISEGGGRDSVAPPGLDNADASDPDPERLRSDLDRGDGELDLDGGQARTAFRDDLRERRYRDIGRFPTLLVARGGPRGLLLTGYRPWEALVESLRKLAPDLRPQKNQASRVGHLRAYVQRWRSVTLPEVASLQGCSSEEARQELAALGLQSAVRDVPVPTA